jgi:hypothetical protein
MYTSILIFDSDPDEALVDGRLLHVRVQVSIEKYTWPKKSLSTFVPSARVIGNAKYSCSVSILAGPSIRNNI